MKKFSIKTVFILLMVLVLAFTLVACGDDSDKNPEPGPDTECTKHVDNDCNGKCDNCDKRVTVKHVDEDGDYECDKCGKELPKPGPNAADFFQGLWDSAATIGSEEITDGDDIALDLGLNLAIGKGGDTVLDLGIAASIVLDRTNAGANSAARIQLYDHDHAENWLTVYFFLNDPYFFYLDWADQHVKVGADFGFNTGWAETINGVVNGGPIIGGMNIAELIASITDEFGTGWNLDGLINSMTGLLGVNLGDLLKSDTVAGLLPTINSVLVSLASSMGMEGYTGIDVDALATSDAIVLDLLKGVGPVLFPNIEVDEDGNTTTYKAGLDFGPQGLLTQVGPLLSSLSLPMGLGNVISGLNEVAFEYTTVDDAIDNFAIKLGVDTDDEPISIEIGINEVSLVACDAADNTFGIDTEDYSEKFELGLELGLSLTQDAVNLWGHDLAGDYKLALKGQVDLINVENNETVAELKLTDGTAQLARITYANGVLAAEIDGTNEKVKLIVEEAAPMLLNMLAGATKVDGTGAVVADEFWQGIAVGAANMLYTEEFADAAAIQAAYAAKTSPENTTKHFTIDTTFKGVALEGINLVNLFTGLFGGAPSYGTAAAGETPMTWSPDIMAILTLLSEVLDGDIKSGLTLSIDNIGETICSVFAQGAGPEDVDEFIYGDGATIVGVMEAVEYNEDGTIKTRDNGKGAEDWFATVVGGSKWAEEGRVIGSVFESDAVIAARLDGGKASLSITVTNGVSEVEISLAAYVTAGTAPAITAIDHTAEGFVTLTL